MRKMQKIGMYGPAPGAILVIGCGVIFLRSQHVDDRGGVIEASILRQVPFAGRRASAACTYRQHGEIFPESLFDQFDLRLDTWPHQPALQKHSKTLANGESRRASSSIGRECGGRKNAWLQNSAPKRLKRLGRSPKLPEGRPQDFPVDAGSINVASKRMPVDFFGREERVHARPARGWRRHRPPSRI